MAPDLEARSAKADARCTRAEPGLLSYIAAAARVAAGEDTTTGLRAAAEALPRKPAARLSMITGRIVGFSASRPRR